MPWGRAATILWAVGSRRKGPDKLAGLARGKLKETESDFGAGPGRSLDGEPALCVGGVVAALGRIGKPMRALPARLISMCKRTLSWPSSGDLDAFPESGCASRK